MGLSLSNWQITGELGWAVLNVQAMMQQLRSGLISKVPPVQLESEVEIDAAYMAAGHKGLMGSECSRTAALAHYRRHADADNLAFTKRAMSVNLTVRSPAFEASLPPTGRIEPGIRRLFKSVLERELPGYDAQRRAAQSAVDALG